MNELIDQLCTGSDRQLDESLKPRLQALKTSDDVLGDLRGICGDIINGSLASGFVLVVLQRIYVAQGGELNDVVGKIHITPLT